MHRFVLLTLLLSLLLCACGPESPPPSAAYLLGVMQTAMSDTAQPLPDGLTYVRTLPAEDPSYLTDPLFSALYGEAARGLLAETDAAGVPAVGDVALFLSVAPYPCELAVFRCSDIRTAATVEALCRGRLDTVARGFAGSEWASVANRGQVAAEGCYVFLVISEDPAAVLARARDALKG
jgi:hypothetical protein